MPNPPTDSPVNAAAIKRLRGSMGWTQGDLERKSGVSLSTVQRAERGEDNLKASTLKPLADALGVPLSAIYDVPAAPERVDADTPPAWFVAFVMDSERRHDEVLHALGRLVDKVESGGVG